MLKKLYGTSFYGNEASEYAKENNKLDYATLAKSFDAVLNNGIIRATSDIGYWEIEFECDDRWSISGIYSFFMKQENKPTEEDIKRLYGVIPNKNGLGKIVSIIDITDEA